MALTTSGTDRWKPTTSTQTQSDRCERAPTYLPIMLPVRVKLQALSRGMRRADRTKMAHRSSLILLMMLVLAKRFHLVADPQLTRVAVKVGILRRLCHQAVPMRIKIRLRNLKCCVITSGEKTRTKVSNALFIFRFLPLMLKEIKKTFRAHATNQSISLWRIQTTATTTWKSMMLRMIIVLG